MPWKHCTLPKTPPSRIRVNPPRLPDMSVMKTRLCHVHGKVQGVFFRASTARVARDLGVTGYARNLPDGRVEVLAVGEEMAVEQLCSWLGQGPPRARVDKVECELLASVPGGYVPGEFITV